jgi:phage anti-repressor protein
MITFFDFLKKYSTIPNNFLEDFYKIFNYQSTNNKDKIVNIDNITKWLNIQKHKLKETLKKSYTIDIDYEIKKINKPTGRGGQKKEIIMLTVECFKMICQSTKSKKGNEIRHYFIEVEKMLDKYKDYIIKGLENKVDVLQKGRKSKVNPTKGVIYVFRTPDSPENNLYKIGKTKDLKKRLQSHSSGLSEDIDILFIQETDDITKIEKCAKEAMKKHQFRKYKEVYQINIDIIKYIIKNCETFHSVLDRIIENEKPSNIEKKKIFMFIPNEKYNTP